MSKLSSEDIECQSYLELTPGDRTVDDTQQIWQHVKLLLRSGNHQVASDDDIHIFMLCRHPHDEVKKLHDVIAGLLDGRQEKALFEPSEPSFELEITKSHHNGFTVHCWIDAGNASTGFYRWDAIGVRFFTTQQLLKSFLQQLSQEFLS